MHRLRLCFRFVSYLGKEVFFLDNQIESREFSMESASLQDLPLLGPFFHPLSPFSANTSPASYPHFDQGGERRWKVILRVSRELLLYTGLAVSPALLIHCGFLFLICIRF